MAPENRLQALFDLLTALSSTLELEEVLSLFTARAAELTGSSSAELSLIHPDGDTVVMLTDWSGNWGTTVGDAYSEAGETYPLGRFETIRRVVEEQHPEQCRVSDEWAEQELRESIARYGISSTLMLPLITSGDTIGLMEVIDTQDRVWEDFDVEFCQALCNVVAPAVRNALLYSEMREMARRDALTGLLNRRAFGERMQSELDRNGDLTRIALLVLDLDGLKKINDTEGGHAAGDAALRLCADVMSASIRATDGAYRLGGDEFAVVLEGASEADAVRVAERISRGVLERSDGRCSLSGGVAAGATGAGSTDVLYRLADRAAYRAKGHGGGRTEVSQAA
jgi:diguanylate cyclase (GGDEF)-like protein